MSRRVVTDWKNWRDIFASESIRTDLSPSAFRPTTLHTWTRKRHATHDRPGPMRLSSFTRIDGNRQRTDVYLDVKLTEQAVETIGSNTIHIDNDTINVNIILWDDGRALVVASHSQIIGGTWLAIIDAATIPAFPSECPCCEASHDHVGLCHDCRNSGCGADGDDPKPGCPVGPAEVPEIDEDAQPEPDRD